MKVKSESEFAQSCPTLSDPMDANDTILIAESEELKSLLMKVKEESEKVGLAQHSEN